MTSPCAPPTYRMTSDRWEVQRHLRDAPSPLRSGPSNALARITSRALHRAAHVSLSRPLACPTRPSTGRRTRSRDWRKERDPLLPLPSSPFAAPSTASPTTKASKPIDDADRGRDAGRLSRLPTRRRSSRTPSTGFRITSWKTTPGIPEGTSKPCPSMQIREALRAMPSTKRWARDDRVFVMGEEVGYYNGAYKVTQGLLEKYGEQPRRRHSDRRGRLCRASESVPRWLGLRPDHRVHDLQLLRRGVRPDLEQRRQAAPPQRAASSPSRWCSADPTRPPTC